MHNMKHILTPEKPVGIVGYGAYIPRYRIPDSEIGRIWHDGAKGLIKEKSVPGLDEDVITMAIEACRNAIKRAQIDPQELRAVWIGSESHPYAVKPSGTVVSEAIGAGPAISAADTEFACKAGTEAMTMAMGLVSSGMGRYALACGMDTAQGRPGDVLEYTAGAGGAAVIIGPVGYILSFLFAWFINELPKWLRAIAVIVFYAPSLGAGVITVFTTLFRADAYGWLNAILIEWGIINAPLMWLLDPRYMLTIVIVVSLWMSMGTGFLSFVAGFQGIDRSMYEAGYVDGVRNRWQELYHITLPSMKPMLLFGAVMSIASSFNISDVPRALCGFPSTDYAARTVVTHLFDYGFVRFEMGYASAVAVILFLAMILSKKAIAALLGRVGT